MAIQPLVDIPISPLIASLPKADLHLHQEERARLERVVARQRGRAPYNWRQAARRLIDDVPAGMDRLTEMYAPDATLDLDNVPGEEPAYLIAKIADALEEAAADGAILVEIRFGSGGGALLRPDFIEIFRTAERQVQARYPLLRAEAIGFLYLPSDMSRLPVVEHHFETCMRMAGAGLSGLDFIVAPYTVEANAAMWQVAYQWADRAAAAGLGITVHAGEFSAANLRATLRVPGLRRIGHGVYIASEPRLLEQVAHSGVAVECCLSCNVVLGAVPSYETHPIKQMVDAGVMVTLNTDDPVRIWTTIGREYAIAAALGFSHDDLLRFTRNAIRASFTSESRKHTLLDSVQQWASIHDAVL